MAKNEKEQVDQATAEAAPRVFNFNGMELPDPDPEMSPEDVKAMYAPMYPEITNATISGPEIVGGKRIFKFTREIGTKG